MDIGFPWGPYFEATNFVKFKISLYIAGGSLSLLVCSRRMYHRMQIDGKHFSLRMQATLQLQVLTIAPSCCLFPWNSEPTKSCAIEMFVPWEK